MDVREAEDLLFGAWERVCANVEELGFDRLSKPQQVFVVIWMLEAELNNGGFSQYLFNSSANHAVLAPSALREVGATGAAEVVERFYALLPGGAPAGTQDERQEQLDSAGATRGEDEFEEHCQQLEQRFYTLEDDLRTRLVAYLATNQLL